MSILFVHENTGPSGGAETNIQITAEELKSRGHRIGLLYSSPKKNAGWVNAFPAAAHLPNEGPSPESGENATGVIPFARKALEEFKPDLIYIHKIRNLRLFEALLESSTPIARMAHDHEMYCLRQYKYNPLTRAICRRSASGYCIFPCLAPVARNRGGGFPLKWASYADRRREINLSKQCDRVFVYSEYSKGELVRNGFEADKIHLFCPIRCWGSNGPISSFSSRNMILFAGQIIRGKGVDLLLKALSKLKIQFECVILGDGNHRKFCEELCEKLGLGNRVKFAGHVPHDQMGRYYVEASVFAMPSVWPEPFGMAGPEAMRYGLPVVAFDAGGISEWLQDGRNGFLAPWMDTDAFAERLERLLTNKPLARELGHNGMADVNNTHDSRAEISRLEHLFREMSKGGQFAAKCHISPTDGAREAAQLFNLIERAPIQGG